MLKADKISGALFVALAVGLGWGIRGHFGGSTGAMFPGAMLGLSFAYVSRQKSMSRWMPVLGAVSALAISAGGNMTYGLLHGYAASGYPAPWYNYAYGFLMLILQGGSWGIFGTAAIALLLEKRSLRLLEVVQLGVFIFFFWWIFSLIIVEWWGFHINPSRGDSLVGHFGGSAGLVLWLIYTKRSYSLRAAILGFMGFGLGMSLGRMNANILDYNHIAINSWNVMEITCGAIGRFIFTFFMPERNYAEPHSEKPLLKTASSFGALFVLGIIPFLLGSGAIKKESLMMQKSLESWGYINAPAIADSMLTWINITVVFGFLFSLIWIYLHFISKKQYPWFPILALGLTIMLIDLFARLYFYYPLKKEGYTDMRTVTVVIYFTMVAYVIVREWKFPHATSKSADEELEKIPWKSWLTATVGAYAIMLLVSSYTNTELMKRKISNTRWPVWSKLNDGPFEKRDSIKINQELIKNKK